MTGRPDPGPVTPGWRPARFVSEHAPCRVAGLDLWACPHERAGFEIVAEHPQHLGQRHAFAVFRATPASGPPVLFALGEVSNTAWVLVLPDGEDRVPAPHRLAHRLASIADAAFRRSAGLGRPGG